MAVKGSATVTLTQYRDIQSVTRYYKLRPAGSSAPLKPETKPPSSDWTDSEPACDISKELYFCDLTIFSNGQWEYSKVSKSSSYEAAKQAYNRAQNAQSSIDNLEIGGRNLLPDTDFGGTSKKHIVPDGVVEGSGGEGGFQFTPTTQIESGIEYTISLRMRGVANVTFYELNTGGNVSHRIARRSDLSETDYKKISLTFVVSADRTFRQVFICTSWGQSATGDWFEIEPKSLKLEKGNKATDWTPAPEDVDAGIANAQGTADSKRRVFYNTPTVPYDAGDLWVQGSGGDILRCAQAKTSTGSYNRNDWVLASKYTDDSALNTWIEGDFATTIQGLEDGIVDAKVETYYQTTDPSTGWSDTQKSEHKGDLWYNSTASVQKYYRWSGTAWQELTATPPHAVFDSIDKKATIYTGTATPTNPSSGDLWFKGVNEPILTYVNNSWVKYNKYTDDTKAEQAIKDAANAQTGVDSLNDSVYGVQTFEYILNGAIIPVYRREDGTYYYILNDEEVTVAEADLVHDSDGELASYRDGGIYDNLDKISNDIDSIGTKVNGFDARENAIYKEIQDNSLIARKNARVTENSLIITNDTTGEAENLLNYLQLNPTSIVIYGNGKDIVTIAKTKDDSGYMEMKGTSLFIAQESRLSTIRLRSAEKIGKLALVAGSDGHVSLKEVLN